MENLRVEGEGEKYRETQVSQTGATCRIELFKYSDLHIFSQ